MPVHLCSDPSNTAIPKRKACPACHCKNCRFAKRLTESRFHAKYLPRVCPYRRHRPPTGLGGSGTEPKGAHEGTGRNMIGGCFSRLNGVRPCVVSSQGLWDHHQRGHVVSMRGRRMIRTKHTGPELQGLAPPASQSATDHPCGWRAPVRVRESTGLRYLKTWPRESVDGASSTPSA